MRSGRGIQNLSSYAMTPKSRQMRGITTAETTKTFQDTELALLSTEVSSDVTADKTENCGHDDDSQVGSLGAASCIPRPGRNEEV